MRSKLKCCLPKVLIFTLYNLSPLSTHSRNYTIYISHAKANAAIPARFKGRPRFHQSRQSPLIYIIKLFSTHKKDTTCKFPGTKIYILHNKVLIPDWFKILDKRDCSHLNPSIISASNIKNTSMILAQKFNLCIVAVPSQVPMSSELITLRIISTISTAMHLQNGNFIRTALTSWGILEGLGYYWVLVLNDSATSLELLPSYKVCLPGYS